MNSITPHQQKALNIDKSISLTANAGSGKTFVLAQRFLQIILKTSTPLNKIAAITFTEKAAGELYKRISDELDKLFLSVEDPELKIRIEKISKLLVSAKISTIHSFCIDLLKEFPVEASLDANFNTINEQKSAELIDISVETTLKELLNDSVINSNVKLLIRLLGSKVRLSSELSQLISKRKNVLNLIEKYYSKSEKEIAEQLFKMFETNTKLLFEDKLQGILNNLKTINDLVITTNPKNELAIETKSILNRIIAEENVIVILAELKELSKKILTKDSTIKIQGYLASKIKQNDQESVEAAEDFFNELAELHFAKDHKIIEKELAKYTIALINVFQIVLSNYEYKKSELGVLDFEDILLKTKMLLENKVVRKSLVGKFNYLLVDEYQDTNEIQYEIFLPLVNDLKSGNLFIVGDEKQSIYRFRDAELQVFSKTKTDISAIDGEESMLTLPDSFRMAPAICFFVNSLFGKLFKAPQLLFNEVPASDIVSARSDGYKGVVEFLIADNEAYNEAELTVKKIVNLKSAYKDRIKEWNDIAILVRKRASFAELQNAFIKYQIPFNLVGGTGFYQKQSISDIYNYFSFLLNDKNDAALIGILRSPFFLISDEKIFELSTFEGNSYWEKIKSAYSINKDLWQKVFEILNQNRVLANRISIPSLLRKILKESGFISVISSRINAVQELSNINKLISITNEFFINDFSTLYDYVTFLNDSIKGTIDESQGRIEPGSVGVNIMTIHQAKGLEYPAVFLYKCSDTTQMNKVKSKSFTIDKDFGILTKVPVNENYFGEYESVPVAGIYNLVEEKKEMAELKRLLYVGLTRAKDFLFLTQTQDGKTAKQNSFSALFEEGLMQDLSGEEIVLSGELAFLNKDQDKFLNITKSIELEIPITRKIELTEKLIETIPVSLDDQKLILSSINDQSKGEVISATRFSTFFSCPMKYNLLYNYKIGDIIQQSRYFQRATRPNVVEEFNRNELESYLFDDRQSATEYSRFKGKVIHQILRKNIEKEDLSSFIEEKLRNTFRENIPENLKEDIFIDLINFYESNEFKFVNSFSTVRNEFEVYLKEEDFYLFGILDRLIIDEKKIIIVDYKTDNIQVNELSSKANKYLPQLKFYAYIISRLFGINKEIEGRIIFIKYPDNAFVFNYDDLSDRKIKTQLISMVNSIRINNYSLNLNSCEDCIFAEEKSKCLMINQERNHLIYNE